MPYTLRLGRIWLPTLNGDYGLTAGDGLEAIGSLVYGGERRPRDLKVTVPIHGEYEDGDPRAVGDRLRRQLEALLENEAARLPAVFMRWAPFPDRDAWLAIGGGDFTDTEGGPTFADYRLELDVKRAATPATHRPGRRLRWSDRRLATTPRDYLGRLYSTDFAGLPMVRLHYLPPGAREALGAGGAPLTPVGVRSGLGGSSLVLPARTNDELVTFERPAAALAGGGGDVVIYDRRGKPDASAAVGLAGPRVNRFNGPDGRGGDLTANFSASVSNAGTPVQTIIEGRRRDDGAWVLYYRVERSDSVTVVMRDGSGTNGVPVTPGGSVSLRARVNVLQCNAALSLRVYWYKADGSSSATASNVVVNAPAGQLTGLFDLGGAIAVPADAAFASIAWVRTSAAGVWELELEDWTIVPGGAGTPAFLHGDDAGRRYLGTPGLSLNALEPQAASGWEEVCGPTQPLSPGDVPVIENGLVRVRRAGVVGGNDGLLAIDTWSASSSAWVERGRGGAYIDAPAATQSLLNTLERADVVEWTPERAVVKVTLSRAANGRGELYITLQRGWTGPRLELYTRRYDGAVAGGGIRYSPAGIANDPAIALKPGTLPIAADDPLGTAWASSDRGAFGPAIENWSAIARVDNAAPALAVAVLQEAARIVTRDDALAYGDNRRAIAVEYRAASVLGYLSAHLGFVASHFAEAELARTGAAGGTVVSDGSSVGTAGANAVETSQSLSGSSVTRRTAAELAAAGVTPGVYGIWARVRCFDAGITASFQAVAGSTAPAVTTTSTALVWLYLGEVTLGATDNFAINAWRSVGAVGALRIDRWVMVALDRRDATDPDYDGARDLAQAELADARQDLALVSR